MLMTEMLYSLCSADGLPPAHTHPTDLDGKPNCDHATVFLSACLLSHPVVLQVGWFLHTPFPSSEMYRTLPVREELLQAVLKADLIGFHTYDYARHFVSACTRILGLEVIFPDFWPFLCLRGGGKGAS